MAINSTKKPSFRNEAEETEWLSSPAGRRFSSRNIDCAMKDGSGTIVKEPENVARSDRAKLEALMARVEAKRTQAISLRLPVEDLHRAKSIAKKTGIGYQTVLKDLLHDALQRAS